MDQIGGDAFALYRKANMADLDHQTAVLAWQGYDAPEFTTRDVPGPRRRGRAAVGR